MPTTTTFSRTQIIAVLKDLGNLCALAGENHFKTRAYQKAVDAFEEMTDEAFNDIDYFRDIDGIGERLADKIHEIKLTGSCDKLQELMPIYGDRLSLMSIKGIGAKTANKLYLEYMVCSVDDLKEMVESGAITAKAVVKAVKNMTVEKRIPLQEANEIADDLCTQISQLDNDDVFGSMEACGSIRRGKSTVGDIDIIVEVLNPNNLEILSTRISSLLLDNVTAQGKSKISGVFRGMHVDIRLANPDTYGAMTLYFTGPRQFNINMRITAIKLGLRLNEYGVWEESNQLAGKTERSVFETLQLDFVPPTERK